MNVAVSMRDSAVAPTAERRFFLGMSLAVLGVVLVGFSRSYYLRPLFPAHPSPHERFYYAVHGVALTGWYLLLVVQSLLIGMRRVRAHRTLGALGGVLAACVVGTCLYGMLLAVARPTGFVGIALPAWQFAVVPFVDALAFAVLVALAVVKRRDAPSDKRLMLLASIAMLVAALARWAPWEGPHQVQFALGAWALLFVPLFVWDRRSLGRIHPVTLWGSAILVASQPLRMLLGHTQLWHGWIDAAAAVVR